MNPYTQQYFASVVDDASRSSAAALVPALVELCSPRSVVDVGCGRGTWLAQVRELGITDVAGIDGDYVDRSALRIPAEQFLGRDLTQPLKLGRTFDLAMCLEVAEHLPPESADTLVSSLAALAPVIAFSAAIPFQRGHGHVNEQWPAYWAQRFRRHGYAAVDCLRQRFWNDPRVAWYYAQNLVLFVARDRVVGLERLRELVPTDDGQEVLSLVHPQKYLAEADPVQWTVGRVFPQLPAMVGRSLTTRLRRLLGRPPGVPTVGRGTVAK